MYVNRKMRPVETIPGMGEGDKGEWWRAWIQVWYIVRTFVSAISIPSTGIKNKIKKMFIILSHQGHADQNYTEIPLHYSQNGYHQENKEQQMLVRMQG
jgi:hypothetical protein